jgi:D-methionine transport system substrate-binding protein
MGLYSKKVTKTDEFKNGDTIAIPNDPSNGGRALAVLEKAGLIKLKAGAGVKATVLDIAENPKQLKITAIEAAQLPRVLTDPKVTGAVINTNYALEGGLNPTKDALYLEDKNSPYANIVVAKESRKDDPNLQKLVKALNTPDVKKFIEDTYKGAVVPAF